MIGGGATMPGGETSSGAPGGGSEVAFTGRVGIMSRSQASNIRSVDQDRGRHLLNSPPISPPPGCPLENG